MPTRIEIGLAWFFAMFYSAVFALSIWAHADGGTKGFLGGVAFLADLCVTLGMWLRYGNV